MKNNPFNSNKGIKTLPSVEIVGLIDKKILFFQDIIQKTSLHVKKNKLLDIISVSEVNNCINILIDIGKNIRDIQDTTIQTKTDSVINILQSINNDLSGLFKSVGTESFEDLLFVCFGNNSVNTYATGDIEIHKFELLKKYFHPTGYKILGSKPTDVVENPKKMDITDINISITSFHLRVYGIQLVIYNHPHKKGLVINGTLDDIMVDVLTNKFIQLKNKTIRENAPTSTAYQGEQFERYIQSLNLKDYLIYEPHDIYLKWAGYISNLNTIKQKHITQMVKDFIVTDLYLKRLIIIQLLLNTDNYDNQYLAYLLYDLLSNDKNGIIDTQEQTTLFESLPWAIKQYFKEAMKQTVKYTSDLSNFDIQQVPLEQQICLLKAPDSVKEKAIQKLKEIKAKSEDSGSKARQYLDGLLKVPFKIYIKEPILDIMDNIKLKYSKLLDKHKSIDVEKKGNYTTSLEILQCINKIKSINKSLVKPMSEPDYIENITEKIKTYSRIKLKETVVKINDLSDKYLLNFGDLKSHNKNMNEIICDIMAFVYHYHYQPDINVNMYVLNSIFDTESNITVNSTDTSLDLLVDIKEIQDKYAEISTYMTDVKHILDMSVHGHDNAKKQIEIIIGQWINGKQDGYCFGFEGPPGVGKTSLAKKGIADCLKDDKGVSRPFAMIQMGGDANGSSLHGHNYTYVGSTWGSIVQILIDKKCMNPIIFIDEIDKISKTEHGKEIIGILTHLLDPAQNDCFQDKYFSGIDLDLSNALFILSYNDVDAIDSILLDRIHRVKFKSLTLDEKLIIASVHILPEIYDKMGLTDMIVFPNNVLKFVIDEYTAEPGVRKLKEILFEIIGEINLAILKQLGADYDIPIYITIHDIKTKYFKDKRDVNRKTIHKDNKIGIINGLWANAQGKGGVIQIQTNWRPSDKFLQLHLTGLQGDVMKESMNVALTLAWKLTTVEKQNKILDSQINIMNGVHIHCPEGATPKDGPSAGTAITTAIYSLLNNQKIKCNIAITGEITLDGEVTEIGGLDLKFLGGIKAGVTEFIFPTDNLKDYEIFMEKYKNDELTKDITFHNVKTIDEVFKLVFE